MQWSVVLPMETAWEVGVGGELDAGGGDQWNKTSRRGEGRNV